MRSREYQRTAFAGGEKIKLKWKRKKEKKAQEALMEREISEDTLVLYQCRREDKGK